MAENVSKKADEKQETVTLPVGTLVMTEKKDKETGELVGVAFRGSTADLHSWEEKNFGIDDKVRKSLEDRDHDLGLMMSDFTAEQVLKHHVPVEVSLGMGNGAQIFQTGREETKHYPVKNADGTFTRMDKTVYGEMGWKTQQIIPRDVREHHAVNQKKIEEQILGEMEKASIK